MEEKKVQKKDEKLKPEEVKKQELEDKKEQEQEKIEQAIKELEKELGLGRENFRIIKVDTSFKKLLKDSIFITLLNIILIMSISGFFVWAKTNSILNYLYFALIFSAFETVISFLIMRLFPQWIGKTLGLVLYLPLIIALVITAKIAEFIEITSIYRFLMMLLILMVSRGLIKNSLMGRKKG